MGQESPDTRWPMGSNVALLRERIHRELLPNFCNDSRRQHSTKGFKDSSIKISEYDATNFLRALDHEIVFDQGGGRYYSAKKGASTQIFWTGLRSKQPRPLTLWIESIIAIGTIARLALDYNWPIASLCLEPNDWAFDLAAFRHPTDGNEWIGVEIKKSSKELDSLIRDLQLLSTRSPLDPPSREYSMNSFKKWNAITRRRVPFFWAVGPNGYSRLFELDRTNVDRIVMAEHTLMQLNSDLHI